MRTAKTPDGPEGAVVGSWRGYTQYRCAGCPFDTLDAEKFVDHWKNCLACNPPQAHEDAPAFEPAPAPVGETLVEG